MAGQRRACGDLAAHRQAFLPAADARRRGAREVRDDDQPGVAGAAVLIRATGDDHGRRLEAGDGVCDRMVTIIDGG